MFAGQGGWSEQQEETADPYATISIYKLHVNTVLLGLKVLLLQNSICCRLLM